MKILVVDDERDIEVLFEQRFRREIKTGKLILLLPTLANKLLII
jgi:hypothetical protein